MQRAHRGFTLIELMIVVAIIAILAVVAVPQLTQYIRNAKAAEANEMLDLIKKGSAAYYTVPRTRKGDGKRVPCQYPTTVNSTPTGSGCCKVDTSGDDRCDPALSAWNNATWAALQFSITDGHYFQYAYNSSGTLKEARYTAEANADLDCDGTFSTFQMIGVGDPAATNADCNSVAAPAIFRNLETE